MGETEASDDGRGAAGALEAWETPKLSRLSLSLAEVAPTSNLDGEGHAS